MLFLFLTAGGLITCDIVTLLALQLPKLGSYLVVQVSGDGPNGTFLPMDSILALRTLVGI